MKSLWKRLKQIGDTGAAVPSYGLTFMSRFPSNAKKTLARPVLAASLLVVVVLAAALISVFSPGPSNEERAANLDDAVPELTAAAVKGLVGGPWILHRARVDNSLEIVLVDNGEAQPIVDVVMSATRQRSSVLLSERWVLYPGPQGLALLDLTTGAQELLGMPAMLTGHDRGAFIVASIAPGSVWRIDPGTGEGSTAREDSVDSGVAAVDFALDGALVARMKLGGEFSRRNVVLRLDDAGTVWQVDSALPEGQVLHAHHDLVAIGVDDQILVHSMAAGRVIQTLPGEGVAIACISPDATSIATLDRRGQGRVFDVASGEETAVFVTAEVALEFAWLPDGEIAFLSPDSASVLVVDPGDGEHLGSIELDPPSPSWMIEVPLLTC